MKPTFVRPATAADLDYIAHNLRAEDHAEVVAATGIDPRLILPLAAEGGREVYTAGLISNNRAEIVFGYDPFPECPSAAVAWMLSTPVIYDYPVEIAVRSRECYDAAHRKYEVLTNFGDERNERHLKWLSWLGFKKLRRIESFGAESRPFIEFVSFRPCA